MIESKNFEGALLEALAGTDFAAGGWTVDLATGVDGAREIGSALVGSAGRTVVIAPTLEGNNWSRTWRGTPWN